MRKALIAVFVAAGLAAVWAGMRWVQSKPLSEAEFAARYAQPLQAPAKGVPVYHLGHSLVGRDMPVMLDQLAKAAGFADHSHASQLGWGASLKNHWTGEVPGFAEENIHPQFRPAREALASGDYPVVVLTEMVELRDAIRWHDSPRALADWAKLVRQARPDATIYLYETWHRLDDPAGWLNRVDGDLASLWEGELLRRAMADPQVGTIYVIPGGQVMAAVVRAIEAGQVPGLSRREDLFAIGADGKPDSIHFNDTGAYVMALTHFAVIYHASPLGLPSNLLRADGSAATSVTPETAKALQNLVWQVVSAYDRTGVPG